ncbi:hypothetical protein OESDEN_16588 [Oesophagostomum dentatum]|uniref:Uncharacterized protein n=1 Tax=Oesophagostomum dentatum TaxID=61180 RepID=A0A0B1SIK6_OESDE|nr:hypothetical protein OESDEN_16588 [Oesophagostomum dentatum]
MVGRVLLPLALLITVHSRSLNENYPLHTSPTEQQHTLEEDTLQPAKKQSGPLKRSICICRHKLCPIGTRCAVTIIPGEEIGFFF